MDILFISNLCSERLLAKKAKEDKIVPMYSIQKLNKLLCVGFVKNGAKVQTFTSIPVTREISSKLLIREKSDKESGINYKYAPTLNIPIIKNIIVLLSTFFFTLFWSFRNKNAVVICDVLQISSCLGALLAAKITRTKLCAIVTDIPGYMVGNNDSNRPTYSTNKSLSSVINMKYINSFDKYVLLTEQMNDLVNINKKPYIIMEGLVDIEMENLIPNRAKGKRRLLYAGGLYEKYGVKILIESFLRLNLEDVEFHLYGTGSLIPYIQSKTYDNKNLIFHGACTNEEVVKAELLATLLINPRPTNEEFTKYSFPSKNMEYMASGVPILTTLLPGMPKEYLPYVYIFSKGETIEGFKETLCEVLSKTDNELLSKGVLAKQFVMRNKNNIRQSKRIILFVGK